MTTARQDGKDATLGVGVRGWAGTSFNWQRSATDTLEEQHITKDDDAPNAGGGWAGTEFDWQRSATGTLEEQQMTKDNDAVPNVDGAGWAGTYFDWQLSATGTLKEQTAKDNVAT